MTATTIATRSHDETMQPPSNKRMQTDQTTRYAPGLAADAGALCGKNSETLDNLNLA